MKITTQQILTSLSKDGVFTITLNNPQKMNCIGFEMLYALQNSVQKAYEDENIKCILFEGAGDKAFSSGANTKEFSNLKEKQVAVICCPTCSRKSASNGALYFSGPVSRQSL